MQKSSNFKLLTNSELLIEKLMTDTDDANELLFYISDLFNIENERY